MNCNPFTFRFLLSNKKYIVFSLIEAGSPIKADFPVETRGFSGFSGECKKFWTRGLSLSKYGGTNTPLIPTKQIPYENVLNWHQQWILFSHKDLKFIHYYVSMYACIYVYMQCIINYLPLVLECGKKLDLDTLKQHTENVIKGYATSGPFVDYERHMELKKETMLISPLALMSTFALLLKGNV